MVSVSSVNVKGLLMVSELSDLKLRPHFSALCVKVRNSLLAFLTKEFVEKISASISAIYFCSVAAVLFFVRWLGFPRDFPNPSLDSICLGGRVNFLYIFCQFKKKGFACFYSELFEGISPDWGGFTVKFVWCSLCKLIAVLQSSLNQGVLCLFENEVFSMASFAIEAWFLVK